MRLGFKICFVMLVFFSLAAKVHARQTNASKPWVFWYWMQGGVSKAGITADLEAMKESGIGGAYLMSIKGPAKDPIYKPAINQLSPEWWDMVRFAMIEAKRLDLKLGMHVSDGFALAGGPWITPALSMQKVVSSRLVVNNTNKKIQLEQPPTKEGYYKDIAVYAYPSPVGTSVNTETVVPKITTSNGKDASGLVNPANKQNFSSSDTCWIQYEFEKPFTCRTIQIKTAGNNYQSQRLIIETSNDGKIFTRATRLEPPRHGWQDTDEDFTSSIAPITAKYFRFVYDKSGSEPGAEDLDAAKWKPSLKILNIRLSAEPYVHQFEGKNGSIWRVSTRTTSTQIENQLAVPLSRILNLTHKLNADGSLDWTPPRGSWTILRIGHTSTGHTNATGGGGMGLECDKFNPEAIKLQFNNWYGEALRIGGPEIASHVLNTFHVDSWECGSQNWSPNFRDEFLKRRGYDLLPYLPIMTGLPVESASASEDFLYDVRKTISELVVDRFYKTLKELANENKVIFSAESVAPTMVSDGLMHYKNVDLPMGEFWLNSPTHDKPNDMLDAISGAHIYGKNTVGAEAFTTVRMDWNEHPGNMKTLMDRNFALGINKMVFHVFTHNPWVDRKPGMTLDGVGLYFQRDQTWWKQGKAWVGYAERVQKLLQEGKPVVDIAVFTGEEYPRRSILPDRLVPVLPGIFGPIVVEAEMKRLENEDEPLRSKPAGVSHSANMADPENWVNPLRGYAYDSFNPDVLLTATVKDHRVIFKSGASYKLLVIPGKTVLNPNYSYMSYNVVKKILDLVKAGATVLISEKPTHQNGMKQVNTTVFDKVVNEIWDGFTLSQEYNEDAFQSFGVQKMYFKKLGLGKVIKGPYYASDFGPIGLFKDVSFTEFLDDHLFPNAKNIAFVHRKSPEKDIYFISNQENKTREISITFPIGNRSVYLYDAVTDQILDPKSYYYSTRKSLTSLLLKMAPNSSIFVILKGFSPDKNVEQAEMATVKTEDISKDWKVQFDPSLGGPSHPVVFDQLNDWTANADERIKYYSGTAIYTKKFTFNGDGAAKVWLDLGDFENIAEVKVNGISCGVLWTAPFKADITKAIQKGENELTIEVTNTWANRLIGDHQLPEERRITKTTAPFRLEGKPLNKAGLIGPVNIQIEEK